MGGFEPLLLLIVIPVMLAIVGFVIGAVLRRRILASASLPEEDIVAVRADLLSAIKAVSRELETQVTLSNYWSSVQLNRADRFRVLKPMLDDQIVRRPATLENWTYWLARAGEYAFCNLPPAVILNSRDWWRLTNGETAVTIIGEQYVNDYSNHFNDDHSSNVSTSVNIDGSSNSVTVTPTVGSAGVEVSSDHQHRGVSASDLARLVEALRTDAANQPPEAAADLRRTAIELSQQLPTTGPPQGRLAALLEKVSTIAKFATSGMEATRSVLDTWGNAAQ